MALASGLLKEAAVVEVEQEVRAGIDASLEATDPRSWDKALARALVRRGLLTKFQARELLAGRRRFTLGQYRVLDEIGRGGMGQVFKAEHGMMGRIVAVKVLPLAKSTPHTEAAFQREIRMLAGLDHENVVRALDAGYDGNVYYLVTEFVPGLDLRRQVAKHGPLDQRQAASVVAQAARGLAYAHRQGVVHRDVKPGNILVTRDGRAKLLDLGLAGSLFDPESMKAGRRVGTPGYMAPEQIRTPQDVGPAADIYGLGCTLYFAVSGKPPFPGTTREDKEQRQRAAPPPLRSRAPNIEKSFAAVVEAMMEPRVEDRIDTAEEVITRLRPWLSAVLVPLAWSGSGPVSGEPASDFTTGSDAQLATDTIQDPPAIDETCAGSWDDQPTIGSGAETLHQPWLESTTAPLLGGRLVRACLLAAPISLSAGLAAGATRLVYPGWGPSPFWATIVAFLVLFAAGAAVTWGAPADSDRRS